MDLKKRRKREYIKSFESLSCFKPVTYEKVLKLATSCVCKFTDVLRSQVFVKKTATSYSLIICSSCIPREKILFRSRRMYSQSF